MRILVVEPNPSHAKLLKDRLTRNSGWSVDTAGTLTKALTSLRHEKYACILCETQIPGCSGIRLIRRLRKAGGVIPVIVVTGNGREQDAAELMHAGATDYLYKSRQALDAIPEIVRKNTERTEVHRGFLPTHVISRFFKQVESVLTRQGPGANDRALKHVRRIREEAERLLKAKV